MGVLTGPFLVSAQALALESTFGGCLRAFSGAAGAGCCVVTQEGRAASSPELPHPGSGR